MSAEFVSYVRTPRLRTDKPCAQTNCASCAALYAIDARRCHDYWISVGCGCKSDHTPDLQVNRGPLANA